MPLMTTRGTKRSGHCCYVAGHPVEGPPLDGGASSLGDKEDRRTKMVIVS